MVVPRRARRATRELAHAATAPVRGVRLAAVGASRLAGGLVADVTSGLDRIGGAVGVGRLLRHHGTPEPDLAAPPEGYPAHRVRDTELPDGTPVRLRPIVPDDALELRAGLKRLSERTRWLRFHSPVSDLPDDQLRHLATVDHHDREAIVAEVQVDRCWQPIGVARFDRTGEAEAELAIVVEDEYQARGVGGLLLDHLIEAAREEGIDRLLGEVLAENRAVLGLLSGRGVALDAVREGTVLHTTTWLVEPPADEPAPPARGSRLRQPIDLIRELTDVANLRGLALDPDEPGED